MADIVARDVALFGHHPVSPHLCAPIKSPPSMKNGLYVTLTCGGRSPGVKSLLNIFVIIQLAYCRLARVPDVSSLQCVHTKSSSTTSAVIGSRSSWKLAVIPGAGLSKTILLSPTNMGAFCLDVTTMANSENSRSNWAIYESLIEMLDQ